MADTEDSMARYQRRMAEQYAAKLLKRHQEQAEERAYYDAQAQQPAPTATPAPKRGPGAGALPAAGRYQTATPRQQDIIRDRKAQARRAGSRKKA